MKPKPSKTQVKRPVSKPISRTCFSLFLCCSKLYCPLLSFAVDADNELKFSVNSEGYYVAEQVPRQVGIRAGSIVKGFVREGHDPNDIEELRSSEMVKGNVTLGQMAKKHKINLNADTLVMEKKARYCTHLCKLDTKDYGLPQTRNRKVRLHLLIFIVICLRRCHRLISCSTSLFGVPMSLMMTWESSSKKSLII